MAEFVEHALEQLLPAFEQLKLTKLLSKSEIVEFINQCRAFEYKCSKRTKNACDFLAYAHYIAEQLDFIETRRRELRYLHHFYSEIELPLKQKCAFIHRICSQRFKKLEYYNEEIAFLHKANMYKACSAAYTRLLQVHGHSVDNYIRAARFEFFDNRHSADSARSILANALRKFPQQPKLWLTFFEIELRYVEFLLQRQHFFLDNEATKANREATQLNGKTNLKNEVVQMESGAVYDDILNLKLVKIVYEMSMKNIEGLRQKSKLLRDFLRITRDCSGFACDLERIFLEHLESLCENPSDDEFNEKANEELYSIDIEGAIKESNTEEEDYMMSLKACEEAHLKKKQASVLDGFNPDDQELKKLLSKATLTEDYDKRPLEEVLVISARQQKKQRKVKRETTTGAPWFSMAEGELTDERRHDLELVLMRDALDPKQHYKKSDREVLPKYFQVGRIVESKADFYSSRMPKKQRKRTLVEELIHDTELLARNKRRYTEIVRRKEATARGTFQHRRTMPKRSRRNNKKRSQQN